MADILYVKAPQKIRVENPSVTVGQIGTLWCSNSAVLAKCNALHYKTMHGIRSVESILDVIERIQEEYPSVAVENLGETDFILECIHDKKKKSWWEWCKVIFVCLIIFFGAAFSIITFNEDVSVMQVFAEVHRMLTGEERKGFTWLEAGYSAGLFLGILIFYNHFRKKKRKSDPTPLEVEMRTYEREVNQTILDEESRIQERQKRLKHREEIG